MRYFIYTLLFVCFLGIFGVANAQLQNPTGGTVGTTVDVNMVPENPKPNEVVFVSLTSYATNLNSANITWRLGVKFKNQVLVKNHLALPHQI